MDPQYLDYPLHFDGRGRTAVTGDNDHVRDMIEQVLFTSPGERVNRPEFGCGLKRLLFMPNGDTLAAATQVLVKSALQKWLEGAIQVESVEVDAAESTLTVKVVYTRRTGGERRTDVFTSPA